MCLHNKCTAGMREHWKDLLLQPAGKRKTHLIKPNKWAEIHLFYLQCDLTNWGEKNNTQNIRP